MLVAAMNPCPCGHHGAGTRRCRCTAHELVAYRRRISGPLVDRIDVHVDVPAVAPALLGTSGGEPTSAVRDRVVRARAAQTERAGRPNARLRGAALRRSCTPDDGGRRLLAAAVERLGLSARGHDKVLRIARTIADLAGSDAVRAEHVGEAVQYRALDRPLA
jgi:magnesium chelatase family protein